MKKFVVAIEYHTCRFDFSILVLRIATSRKAAIKQTLSDATGVHSPEVLFCEVVTPKLEKTAIENLKAAIEDETTEYFKKAYIPIGCPRAAYNIARNRRITIEEFVHMICPEINVNELT